MIRFVQQLGLAGAVSLTVAMGLRAADLPSEILQESGWTGGVAVCVGYDEAGRISPLPGFRTQLLESDSQSVARARTRVIAEKVGDNVTVKRWEHGFPGALFTATNGFLDEGMYDRDAWSFHGVMGKMISFNEEAVYLAQWLNQKDTWHKLIFDLAKHHYAVRSVARQASKASATPKLQRRGKGAPRSRGAPADLWQSQVPLRPAAMVLTRDVLFICGVPFFQDAPQLRDSIAGDKGGVLIALDDRTGQLLSQTELPAAPVWDGMAAAGGSLFVSKKDGSVSCYR